MPLKHSRLKIQLRFTTILYYQLSDVFELIEIVRDYFVKNYFFEIV